MRKLLIILGIALLIFTFNINAQYITHNGNSITYNDNIIVSEAYKLKQYTVVPDTASDGTVYGCTGMDYNTDLDLLMISRYNYDPDDNSNSITSKVMLKDRNNNLIDSIDITSFLDHIQGVTYNSDLGINYAWGRVLGEGVQNTAIIVSFDNDGNQIGESDTTNFLGNPGMLSYDITRQSVWLKSNGRTKAYLVDTVNFERIDSVQTFIGGEGMGVSKDGLYLWLTNQGLHKFEISTETLIASYPSVAFNNQDEGCTVDPVYNGVWVCKDEYLHGGIKGGNRSWLLNPEGNFFSEKK